MLENIFLKVLDLIYPIKCPICNKNIINRNESICKFCESTLKYKNFTTNIELQDSKSIKCISSFEYSGNIKKSIFRFKFRGYKDYSKFFAKFMCKSLKDEFKDLNFDYITFVPIGKERKRNRGYNQSECLASDISSILDIPYIETLIKIKSNHVQHELRLENRKENVKGVYGIKNALKIKGKSILICDDIITSGSTLRECSKILLENGAREVYCCVIANVIQCNFLGMNL